MSSDERKKRIFKRLKKKHGKEDALAILANMGHETGGTYDPKEKQKNGPAVGLIQWEGPRKESLLKRKDPLSMDTQLDFLDEELNTTERRNFNKVKQAGTVFDKTKAFSDFVERPGKPKMKRRMQVADDLVGQGVVPYRRTSSKNLEEFNLVPSADEIDNMLGQKRNLVETELEVQKAKMDADRKIMSIELASTEEGQSAIRDAIKTSDLPENVKESLERDVKNPDKFVKSLERSEKSKEMGTNPSPKDNFMEALTFFLPNLLGGLVGSAIAGEEGFVEGEAKGGQLGQSFRDHQLKKESMASKPTNKLQQSEFTDKQGNPLMFNPTTGDYLKVDGTKANQGDFVDHKTARQANSLAAKSKDQALAALKFEHGIAKDSQLSDKQAERLEGMTAVLASVERIDTIQDEVATGLGRGRFQSLAEFADAAPEKFTELKTETASALANYVKSISGAQVSEQEAQRLAAIIPSVNDGPRAFNVKLKTFKRIVETNKKAFAKAIMTGQPLKSGTVKGLVEAEKELSSTVPKKKVTSTDIDNMTKEELKAFLGE